MYKKCSTTIATTFLFLFSAWFCQAQDQADKITIGVLAKDGLIEARKQWEATGQYLTDSLNRPFTIVPLAFNEVLPAVKNEKINFLIVNPSLFITSKILYSSQPVVTMNSSGNASFGGVIFTTANNRIADLNDLQGKKFGAVQKTSLGGWQMAHKEFMDSGIEVFSHVSSFRFFDTHAKVVRAVLNQQVHAGTVRTGVLEKMAKNGEIKMADIKVLEKKYYPDFPLLVSTRLYPEWVLARTASTDTQLADYVAEALKNMSDQSEAAVAARCTWTDPGDYFAVEELQKQLKTGAYEEKN